LLLHIWLIILLIFIVHRKLLLLRKRSWTISLEIRMENHKMPWESKSIAPE
jgi:hypothetical protein